MLECNSTLTHVTFNKKEKKKKLHIEAPWLQNKYFIESSSNLVYNFSYALLAFLMFVPETLKTENQRFQFSTPWLLITS